MSNWIEGQPERVIVTAACRYTFDDGSQLVFVGVRHYCPVMVAQIKAANLLREDVREMEQGFIDNKGVFLDRKEALAVAIAANQVNTRRTKTFPENELFSEDIH